LRIAKNIKPISYLKSHASEVLRSVTAGKNPLLITHHGEVKLVVQDIEGYEEMRESLALLKILALGEEDRRAGRWKPLKRTFADLRKRIGKSKFRNPA
jgi:prevent-host-death family protein